MSNGPELLSASEAAWQGVSAAFAALGRVFVCLNDEYRVIHASLTLDDILGPGSARRVESRPIEELLGADLFGPAGLLRAALEAGERREGWRAQLRLDDGDSHVVSISVAPFPRHLFTACDSHVKAIIVVRAATTTMKRPVERQRLRTGSWRVRARCSASFH